MIAQLHLLKNLAVSRFRSAKATILRRTAETYELGREVPVQTFYSGKLFDPFRVRVGLQPIAGIPACGLPPYQSDLGGLALANASVTFAIDPGRSFFGDCLNVVDAPNELPLDSSFPPFGWSGRPLLGGHAITASALSGEITLRFGDRTDDFIPFALDHSGGLTGRDSVLSAPDGYCLQSVSNSVHNAEPLSRGQLDVQSGRVHDFHYNVRFWNSAIERLLETNPALSPPPLLFPGLPHAGHAMAWLKIDEKTQRLQLGIAAEQFLPLGSGTTSSPLMLPPSESNHSRQSPFSARNSSLHPFIFITAIGPEVTGPLLTSRRVKPSAMAPIQFIDRARLEPAMGLAQFENKTIQLLCLSSDTNFGDDFALRSESLGGSVMAQSPLFGELEVQFGTAVEGDMPFILKFDAPSEAFRQKFSDLLLLLPPGTTEGLVGMCGEMDFPKVTFFQRELSLTTDPYKPSIGIVNTDTGRSAPFVLRKYLFQNVMKLLLMVEPRTPTDSFAYLSIANFFQTQDGKIGLHLTGENFIPYPEGYRFPLPHGGATTIQKGSFLRPFVNLLALEAGAFSKPTSELRFVSHTYRRGKMRGPVHLSLTPAADKTTLALRCGNQTFGADCTCRVARVGDAVIYIFSFAAKSRNDETSCHAVLTTQRGQGELQLIAVDESLDLWVAGTCEMIS